MESKAKTWSLTVALATISIAAGAQIMEKHVLTLEGAKTAISAAEAEAKRLGVGGAIAVVDDGGNLLNFVRIDGTFAAGANVSIDKARTAAMFKKPTKAFEDIINNGRFTMTALPDFTPLQGGVPISVGDRVVGAIGMSGASSAQQDEEIAMVGAKAVSAPSVGRSQDSDAPTQTSMESSRSGTTTSDERFLVSRDKSGVALQGYDPVAYFTDQKPAKGNPKWKSEHKHATYYFASAEHKDLFDAAPGKYEPQFGGYCGYAASINRISPINPNFWQVLDGRLVLQHNQKALDKWNEDLNGNLAKADTNWPGLVAKNGIGPKDLINTDRKGVAIQGYDPVAYFLEGSPMKGKKEFESTYNGALYHFVSQDHRYKFEDNPSKYVPQFGGFCGYAASINKVSPINPKYWQIQDGRLVLQHTKKAYDLFNQDAAGNYAKAQANWPGLVQKYGK
ncbi:MAG: heme-binding protein [Candidatus Hydrogenedentes bacterium]|nr:heme-binding protein [Candidatus Hydrogenedentota bacterium]